MTQKPNIEISIQMEGKNTSCQHAVIKHCEDSAIFERHNIYQRCSGLIEKCFEMRNVSYLHPLRVVSLLLFLIQKGRL